MFKTMREVKANYKGNNLQHRVVKKLSKAARDCGITSLGSYRLEYKERQKQYNARRDAASAVQVIKLFDTIALYAYLPGTCSTIDVAFESCCCVEK